MKHLMKRAWTKYALVAVVTAMVIAPTAAIASHNFTDVPDGYTFHNNIQWMKDNGITLGCNPPANDKYCPDNAVSRGQMSAFMQRLAQNKVVDAKTALTAGHATTADSATTAATAANATNATNADKLDGIDSSSFLPDGTPPVGTTARGNYALGGNGSFAWEGVAWGFNMPVAPVTHFLVAGSSPTTECPGTAANPQAIAGHLCAYEGSASNVNSQYWFKAGGISGADVFGANLLGYRTAAGDFWSYGSWAITVGTAVAGTAQDDGLVAP